MDACTVRNNLFFMYSDVNEGQKKNAVPFGEMMLAYSKRPKQEYLWSGIKKGSFGLVFGPSKSGKTIFCENLAMSLAIGRKEFFGYPLKGKPEKVLFIGLEEYWESRAERNSNQFDFLDEYEKEMLNENYLYQPIEFKQSIVKTEDWKELCEFIRNSGAKVVFIDSITRMNPGQLENSSDAEKLMQNLRSITYELGVTLICIHHTPKMFDCAITMDKIKGSAVFAQESDFAIGINRTSKGFRYVKNVFFRYASDDFERVHEFEINDSQWLDYIGDEVEDKIIDRSDRRKKSDNREFIIGYFNDNPNMTYSTAELISYFESNLPIKERMIKKYLTELEKNNNIYSPGHGYYSSMKNFDLLS